MKKDEFEKIITQPGVMLHGTPIDNSRPGELEKDLQKIKNIFTYGVLPISNQLIKYGQTNIGEGCDLQEILGAFDYISVYDPYLGYNSRPEDRDISKYQILKQEFRRLALEKDPSIRTNAAISKGEKWGELGKFINYISLCQEEKAGFSFNLDAVLNEKYKDFFQYINNRMEETFKRKDTNFPEKPVLYKISPSGEIITKNVNIPLFFEAGTSGSRRMGVGFFIDPRVERAAAIPSMYTFESFIKGKINLENIIAVALRDNSPTKEEMEKMRAAHLQENTQSTFNECVYVPEDFKEELFSELKTMCEQNNIPFYKYESNKWIHTVQAFKKF